MSADRKPNDLGRYDKLFQKGIIQGNVSYLQSLINTKLIVDSNAFYWAQPNHYVVDPIPVPLPVGKEEPYIMVKNIVRQVATLPDVHNVMAEVSQKITHGHASQTVTLMQFAHGLYSTAYSREELKAWMDELGGDGELVKQYITDVSDLVIGHNYNMSRLCAQRTSTGEGETHVGQGGKRKMPSMLDAQKNFFDFGVSIIDPDCDIFEELKKIEDPILDKLGDDRSQWRNDVDDVYLRRYWITNKYVIDIVNRWKEATGRNGVIIYDSANPDSRFTGAITLQDLLNYTHSAESKIAPVYEQKEYQFEQQRPGRFKTRGWKEGNIAFRRDVNVGVIKKSPIQDIKFLTTEAAPDIIVNTASIQGGLMYLANIVSPDGLLRKYSTNVYSSIIPIIDNFIDHYIIRS